MTCSSWQPALSCRRAEDMNTDADRPTDVPNGPAFALAGFGAQARLRPGGLRRASLRQALGSRPLRKPTYPWAFLNPWETTQRSARHRALFAFLAFFAAKPSPSAVAAVPL